MTSRSKFYNFKYLINLNSIFTGLLILFWCILFIWTKPLPYYINHVMWRVGNFSGTYDLVGYSNSFVLISILSLPVVILFNFPFYFFIRKHLSRIKDLRHLQFIFILLLQIMSYQLLLYVLLKTEIFLKLNLVVVGNYFVFVLIEGLLKGGIIFLLFFVLIRIRYWLKNLKKIKLQREFKKENNALLLEHEKTITKLHDELTSHPKFD